MDVVIIIAAVALANVACFIIGVKTGVAVVKGEELKVIDLPDIPRAFDYAKKQDELEADLERQQLETILQNIENYDGTSYGQKDVPRG